MLRAIFSLSLPLSPFSQYHPRIPISFSLLPRLRHIQLEDVGEMMVELVKHIPFVQPSLLEVRNVLVVAGLVVVPDLLSIDDYLHPPYAVVSGQEIDGFLSTIKLIGQVEHLAGLLRGNTHQLNTLKSAFS